VNNSGLRFQDEFVRHKILDLIGDLALLGVPCIGHEVAYRSGHTLHTKLVEAILDQPDKWVLLNADEQAAEAMSRRRLDSLLAHPAVPLHAASPAL
ncbi:MAG: UDP-3-O-acyl-N-acetylglucosamine deacetylase, partial [Nitrospirales bacterium]